MWVAFDYMYRDAGNFKAFATVNIEGRLAPGDQELVRSRLLSGEFFIAEQVGVPALYRQLYKWSGGPTKDDHCWHEFVGFRELAEPDANGATVGACDFVARFANVRDWNEGLSPHFWLDGAL